ncbi:peptidylprolyl isomerase [Brevibacillus sp. SYP-B805]|uniref:peptidyl-prolyl cis-trans isomerase n=1 Tax=Brevibacillus sp. SYP-B805 TaxID=1578199 RepID=UPI0013EC51FD|nr:peptidyl-prolyl cis-trans isomerase [Brevibacillus sp. SYP-B805]NGQ96413.1 peptidylprolyl isomerase [Brevibacillus sp. SYP-B805]
MNNVKMLWSLIAALVLLVAVVTWSWYKQASELQAAAVVGGTTITEADWIRNLKQKYGQQVLEDMIDREVVFQEAKRIGLTLDPKRVDEEIAKIKESYGPEQDFQTALKEQAGTDLDALRQEVTYQLLLQELATRDIAVSEDEMKNEYNKHKDRYAKPMRARVWQIVVASQAEAKQVQRELQAGANFSTLAKERSIDTLTAANGGDLGWVSSEDQDLPDQMKETIASLPLNQDSNPIPLDGQYAIIRVLERQDAEQLPYEAVKEQIRHELALAQVESLDQVLERLKQAVGVRIVGKQ